MTGPTVLDTRLDGASNSVLGAADWLSQHVAPGVEAGAEALRVARRDGELGWEGAAGAAFNQRMRTACPKAEELHRGIVELARDIETYGHELRIAQERMATVRAEAIAAGLRVEGDLVHPPGTALVAPGPPPYGPFVTRAQELAHQAAKDAYLAQHGALTAWAKLTADAEFAREQCRNAGQRLIDRYRGLEGMHWMLTAAEIAGEVNAGHLKDEAKRLRAVSGRLAEESREALTRLRSSGSAGWVDDLTTWQRAGSQSAATARQADDLLRVGRAADWGVGGTLTGIGIVYDIRRGKDPVQATASGTGGFLAGVAASSATGMVIGSFVPVPVVGTISGAVVGAAFGIATSAAIDSLFENGPDVQQALAEGGGAVVDTGKVIGGAVVGGAKRIGGWLS